MQDQDLMNLYILAVERFQKIDQKDPLSWFQIAGIHGRVRCLPLFYNNLLCIVKQSSYNIPSLISPTTVLEVLSTLAVTALIAPSCFPLGEFMT